MPYEALKIANYFIDKAQSESLPLTPMKLLKLVYLAHGWHLGFTGQPLINERIQAWKYGPVIDALYKEFRGYGGGEIKSKGVFYESGAKVYSQPMISPSDSTATFLDAIWAGYRHFTGGQLSTLTHQVGTPWYEVWEVRGGKFMRGAVISDELIKEHFERLKRERIPEA